MFASVEMRFLLLGWWLLVVTVGASPANSVWGDTVTLSRFRTFCAMEEIDMVP
jgi:hypothetical protein